MRNENVHGKWIAVGAAAVGAALIAVNVQTSQAYPRYTDGCDDCHGAFDDDTSPKGTVFPNGGKHDMHRKSQYMDTACDLCHVQEGDDPLLDESGSDGYGGGPGPGCVGCHGRDYGPGIGHKGAGLRRHHALHDVTTCGGCHSDDPNPLPENVNPWFYGSADTLASDSCNPLIPPDMWGENFSLDVDNNDGQDNDGDGLYDENDPDCDRSCPCDCEAVPDGTVDAGDFLALLAQWGGPGSCDCEDPPDGSVDAGDFLALLAGWGDCP